MTVNLLDLKPSVTAWEWDRGRPTATKGARILRGKWAIFIPAHSLRHVADRLHDIADEYDQKAHTISGVYSTSVNTTGRGEK